MKSFVALSILVLCAPSASAQTDDAKAPPAPVSSAAAPRDAPTGQLRVSGRVHIGETAPDFTAYSTTDREVTLSRLRGDWIVLLFANNREEFGALRAVYDPAAGYGARTIGICKDKTQRLRSYTESQRLPFELLADDTGEISSIYGYYDLEQRATTPGFVVIDRRGVVRLALQGEVQPQSIVDLVRFTIVGEKSTSARTP
jgi:peroxiredoxin